MIKFEHTEVLNFEGAIRGMRNPLNSWDLSDSLTVFDSVNAEWEFHIGENDLNLAHNLATAGTDHGKFLRQIMVSVDITAPLYWWKEFDTYKVGTVANSCSTMHKIHAKEFTLEDFSIEYLNELERREMNCIINILNRNREAFLEVKDGVTHVDAVDAKIFWWNMIQLLPSSYNQKRTVTLNYAVLRNIYNSRRNHKLDEWSIGFMEWIDSLPYSEELIKC